MTDVPCVKIIVEGGIAHVVRKSPGVKVVIRDIDEYSPDPVIDTILEASEVI
jgi:hypothetical protein